MDYETQDDDDTDGSVETRWFAYKRQQRAKGGVQLSWGDWLTAGQPLDDKSER